MSTRDSRQVVTFCLGDDQFATDIADVERVLRYSRPTPIPRLPEWAEGVLEYRERVVPVIDLRRRFGMSATEIRQQTRILVFELESGWVGATVDAVLEVATLDASDVTAPPPIFRGLSAEYIKGLAKRGDKLLIHLDAGRLLTATEQLLLHDAARGVLADA
jgi:purine-binding chemotaxis protein CheW